MTVEESSLPGVGKKFEVTLDDGALVIVIHNTGKREIFRRDEPEADAEKVFEFDDQLARTVGSIIEGAHFQPTDTDRRETTLPGGLMLEWYEVAPGSHLIGDTIEEVDVGSRTGASIIAVQRGDETLTSPPPDTTFHEGDMLFVVGTSENCEAFESLLGET